MAKKPSSFGKKRKPLKKASKKRQSRLRVYYKGQKEFLAENPYCVICPARGVRPPNRSTEVHHIRGRIGRLLTDYRFFAASCRACREWPHENPLAARQAGLLARAGEWGVFPC